MIEFLTQLNHWHWLALGLCLLAVELIGTAGYFLWLGISALIVGVVVVFLPIGWQLQWMSFASFSLITTWLWWRKQLSTDKEDDAHRELNQKDKQLIGKTSVVEQDVEAGQFRLILGDTTWTAECDVPLKAGTRVKVIHVDGIVVKVEPI
ncbi:MULTISPECIES: NfeD family protein [Vibrio]|uniref:NfeD family protein n=1 Tax=Vibrio diazotrophicus TaxID=685 RepID=A0A2J8HJ02_VIBDI|nr:MULTISPECIES: NfeD family protein [Vibrio]MCF7362552.1 NfeD family protein [Vibrio sp. A1-b2]PNH81086.1 NfeD family protein [Vibrio diazotrophicus]PNH98233.1 NfeD family protein [Vibrio diazotrophicus]PNH99519.1 NfeD family protein [Vibrio diazotrophicus]PNI06074.1 NfeD family protein [Vibrio diazotrophicus]